MATVIAEERKIAFSEKCFVCGQTSDFKLPADACLFREAACSHCGSAKRSSDLARFLLDAVGLPEDGCLADQLDALRELRVYNTCNFGGIHEALKSLPHYVCSEYFDDVRPGDISADGVLCADLTRLHFPADSFDLVICEDVLEHIPDYVAAFQELRRVLAPDGHLLFTVPAHDTHPTRLRARRDGSGRVEHILPPVYHGDAKRLEGALVYTDFGSDLEMLLRDLGLPASVTLATSWHLPEDVTWIEGQETYDEYCNHYDRGTLLSAFRYNSYVAICRCLKQKFTGERLILDSGVPRLGIYEHLQRYAFAGTFTKDKEVLDIACGEGYGSAFLARHARKVTGVDISEDTVAYANERYGHLPNVEFRAASCTEIPLPDDSVDVVVSMETVEHVLEHESFFLEVRRVLRPGGTFVVSTPNPPLDHYAHGEQNPYHLKLLELDEARNLATAHFPHCRTFGQRVLPVAMVLELDQPGTPQLTWSEFRSYEVEETENLSVTPRFFLLCCSDVEVDQPDLSAAMIDVNHQDYLEELVRREVELDRDAMHQECETSRVYAESMEKSVVESERYAKSLETVVQRFQQRIDTLQNELAASQTHVDDTNHTCRVVERIRNEQAEIRQHCEHLGQQLEQARRQSEQIQQEREGMQLRLDRARQETAETRQFLEQHRKRRAQIEQQRDQAREECQAIQQQFDVATAEAQRILDQNQEQCSQIELQRDQARQECQSLQQQFDQTTAELQHLLDQSREQCAAIEQQRDQAGQECQTVTQQLEQSREECAAIEQQRDQASQECQAVQQQLDQSREQSVVIEQQLEQATQAAAETQQLLAQSREQCAETQQQRDQARKYVEQARLEIEQISRQVQSLRLSEGELGEKLAQLKRCRVLKLRDFALTTLRRVPIVRSSAFVKARNAVSI